MKKIFLPLALIFSVLQISCMSIQKDIYVDEETLQDSGFSQEIESRIAMLDADFYMGKSLEETSSARTYVLNQLDSKLSLSQLDKNQEAKLQALKGRLLLLGAKSSQAQKCYDRARKLNASDVQVIILERRLGITKDFSQKILDSDLGGVLVLEAALEQFENENFAESAGLFDRAFISAPPFYRSSYQAVRDKAWSLKDLNLSQGNSSLLVKNRLSLLEFLDLVQSSSSILDFYVSGRNLSGQKLFNAVREAGLLDAKSAYDSLEKQTEVTPVDSKTVASRILCARFLWNVYTKDYDPSYAVKYSSKTRAKSVPKSPVLDLDVYSEDYDAVLGCVENEIMSLVDGRNFKGSEPVTASELVSSLSAMK